MVFNGWLQQKLWAQTLAVASERESGSALSAGQSRRPASDAMASVDGYAVGFWRVVSTVDASQRVAGGF